MPTLDELLASIHSHSNEMQKNLLGGFAPIQTGNHFNDFIINSLKTAPLVLGAKGPSTMTPRNYGIAQQKMQGPQDAPNISPTQLSITESQLPPGMESVNNPNVNFEPTPLNTKFMGGELRPSNDEPFNIHNRYSTPYEGHLHESLLRILGKEENISPYQKALNNQKYDKELKFLKYSEDQIRKMSYQTKKDIVEGKLE